MPTALITGVNGQDGSYLAEFLLGRRYVVIGTVRPGGGARLQRIAHLLRQIEVIELGLSDSETLENVIRRYAPDEVYNLAARASGLGLWDSPVATGEINGLFVTRLLEAHQETLSALLHDLADKVQLTVKGTYNEELMLREIVESTPAIAELNERIRTVSVEAAYYDRIRLGELVAAEVDHHRVADTVAAVARLEPLAEAVCEHEVRQPSAAYDLAFLVRREAMDDFTEGVGALDREVGDRIELSYVGPSPAYSFAEANLDEGSPAWA